MLVRHPTDQRGLHHQGSDDRQHLRTILPPRRQLMEKHFASRWQRVLADSEALQLPPIEHWRYRFARCDGNVASFFAVQNTQSKPCAFLSARLGDSYEAASASMSNEGRYVSHDRSVGRLGDAN